MHQCACARTCVCVVCVSLGCKALDNTSFLWFLTYTETYTVHTYTEYDIWIQCIERGGPMTCLNSSLASPGVSDLEGVQPLKPKLHYHLSILIMKQGSKAWRLELTTTFQKLPSSLNNRAILCILSVGQCFSPEGPCRGGRTQDLHVQEFLCFPSLLANQWPSELEE